MHSTYASNIIKRFKYVCQLIIAMAFQFRKACKKNLITKKCIVTHTLKLKLALYFSDFITLLIKLFNNSARLKLLPQLYKPALF